MTKQQIEAFGKITKGQWNKNESSVTAKWKTGETIQVAVIGFTRWTTSPEYDDVEANRARNLRMQDESSANGISIAALPELLAEREEMIAALKELREVAAACFRMIAVNDDPDGLTDWLTFELKRLGIRPGFGKWAQDLIAKAEGE